MGLGPSKLSLGTSPSTQECPVGPGTRSCSAPALCVDLNGHAAGLRGVLYLLSTHSEKLQAHLGQPGIHHATQIVHNPISS